MWVCLLAHRLNSEQSGLTSPVLFGSSPIHLPARPPACLPACPPACLRCLPACLPGCSEELLKLLAEQMQGLVIPAAKKYYRYCCRAVVYCTVLPLVAVGCLARCTLPSPSPTYQSTLPTTVHCPIESLLYSFFPPVACRYGETQVPDVWFDTRVVWEVKCADMSIR